MDRKRIGGGIGHTIYRIDVPFGVRDSGMGATRQASFSE